MTINHDTDHTRVATRPDGAPAAPWSPRTDRRLAWVGGHLFELAGCMTPVVAAGSTGQPLWALLGVAVAAAWARHEWRQNRQPGARGGALTLNRQPGTDATSPTDAVRVPVGDTPGEEDTREQA